MPGTENIELAIEVGAVMCSRDDRTVTGMLLPFGEVGRTSVGKLQVGPGVVTIPADPSVVYANSEHDRWANVAHATQITETAQGILASWKIAQIPEGDELLTDLEAGKRAYLSVELAPGARIAAGGVIKSARLAGAAFTSTPAFESAAIYASATETEQENTMPETETLEPVTASAPAAPQPAAPATVPESVLASRRANPAKPKTLGRREAMELFARRARGQALDSADASRLDQTLAAPVFAALDFVDFSGTAGDTAEISEVQGIPQWLGQLYQGEYSQGLTVVSDLIGKRPLTSRSVTGFKVTTFPTGGAWAGNGAAITSGGFKTDPQGPYNAVSWAGADSIGREFFDFGIDAALMDAYFGYQIKNFWHAVDQAILTAITPATAVVADDPTGLSIGAAWSQIIDAMMLVINNYGGLPNFVLVEPSLYKAAMKIPTVDALGYLSAALHVSNGDLEGLTIRPDITHTLATGDVLAGNGTEGATLYTLPGIPVRAQALNAIGSIDVGLIGYYLALLNNANSFALVSPHV